MPSSPRPTRSGVRGNSLPEEQDDEDVSLDEGSVIEELPGAPGSDPDEERLMHSVLENDEQAIDDGKVIAESFNQGVGSFTPDLLFKNLVKNFQNAKRLYGETLLRELTSYRPEYVERNLSIPEFRDKLQRVIADRVEGLKERGVLDSESVVTKQGSRLAALVLAVEELDHLASKGLGRLDRKERDKYGEKEDAVQYAKSVHRFRDVALKRSVKTALRRGHTTLEERDLQAYERRRKGRIQVVFAVDSSGSMRGEKISMCKRAGIALAYKAIEEGNEAGLVVFTSEIEAAIAPTRSFTELLDQLVTIKAGWETDLAKTIDAAAGLFSKGKHTKHLVILTDALPTKGKDPKRDSLKAAGNARDAGVTISMVGINLDVDGEKLARDLVEVGAGRLYRVENLEELDRVVLEDYDRLREDAGSA